MNYDCRGQYGKFFEARASPVVVKAKEPINPFYALLVLVGIAFTVTACAYGVMAFRAVAPRERGATAEPHPLLVFLDERGLPLMGAELALLGVATVAAMAVDQRRARRAMHPSVSGTQRVPSDSAS